MDLQAALTQGLTLHRQNRLAEAKAIYEAILKADERHFDALNLLGALFLQLADFPAAVTLFDKAIAVNPSVVAAHVNRGKALTAAGRLQEAVESYDRAVALSPAREEVLGDRGGLLLELGRPAEALASLDQALALNAQRAEYHYNRGGALRDLRQFDAALESFNKAIALKPDFANAYNNQGSVLLECRRPLAALSSFDRALELDSRSAEFHNNRGSALTQLGRHHEARLALDQALTLRSDYGEARNNLGNTLMGLKRTEEALAEYNKAIALKPDYAEAYSNRGNALLELRQPSAALASYDRAVALRPNYAEAYNNRGQVLTGLGRLEEALASYDKALVLKPDYAAAHYNRGVAIETAGRLEEALLSYNKAYALDPDLDSLLSICVHTKMKLCDWTNFSSSIEKLSEGVRATKKVSGPFALLSLTDDPHLQRKAAEIYAANHPRTDASGARTKRGHQDKIRIGYYSASFYRHAIGNIVADLFEAHDRSKFDIFAFSFSPDRQDEVRARISGAVTEFIDIRHLSDLSAAQISRDMGIDIAVDLAGYLQDGRLGLFAAGCAPIQVNYFGYPGTMGADYLDYVVADRTVIPENREQDFTEKVVWLPHSYMVNGVTRPISDKIFARGELGLPDAGFVFCCFNNSYKILPDTFDIWMRLLKAVDGSVLWLLADSAAAMANLRAEAAARGVDRKRLVFAERLPVDQHLARHRLADLFLDTFPYNAHTTASDALWMGLPIVTLAGKSFASRVAASLLRAIALPELITESAAEYEAKALELAKDRSKLSAIRDMLDTNRLSTPLFDSRLFAGHMEKAYREMYERHHNGLPAVSFAIQP